MRLLKRVLNFYINTSIHVGLAVFSLVQITEYYLNIFVASNLEFFIFFGTVFGYNFLKYFEIFWNRIFTVIKNYSILLVSIIALIGIIYCFFEFEKNIQYEFVKIGLLVLIYPFIRKFGFIKMVFVSFCLTLITVYIPMLPSNSNSIYLLQRFLIIFCLLIPLEIIDIESDSKTIQTLPKIIGINNLKFLGYFLLIVFCILNICFLKLNVAIDIVVAFVTATFIFFSKENRSKYYTSFWVESIPIFWWFLGLLFC